MPITVFECVLSAECSRAFQFSTKDCSGSRTSLNESVLLKHQKTRFQQSNLDDTRARGIISQSTCPKRAQQECVDDIVSMPLLSSAGYGQKTHRLLFKPDKCFASTTKLINQNIFSKQHSKGKMFPDGNSKFGHNISRSVVCTYKAK